MLSVITSPWIQLAGVFAVGFALRLWLMSFIPVIETDGAVYARLAQEIVTGTGSRGFHPAWPPLYPHLIAGTAILLHHGLPATLEGVARPDRVEAAARLVNCILGSLLPLLLFFPARRMAGPTGGVVAVCIAAFHPRLLVLSVQALTEIPFAFFCVLFMLAMSPVVSESDHPRPWIPAGFAGLAGGLAFLTRPEGLVLLPIGGLAILVAGLGGDRTAAWLKRVVPRPGGRNSIVPRPADGRSADLIKPTPTRLAVTLIAFIVIFSIFGVGRVAEVSRAVGHFSIGSKSDYNLLAAYAGEPGIPQIDGSRSQYNNFPAPGSSLGFRPEPVPRFPLVHLVFGRPGLLARHFLKELPAAVAGLPSLAYPLFTLLAMAGLWLQRRRSQEELLWLFFWLALVGLYSFLFVYRRFFAGALPLLLVESAIGLVLICRRRPAFIAAALAALAVYGTVSAATSVRNEPYAVEEREIANAALASGRGAIAARKPFTAYYAGLAIVSIPDVPPADLVAEARLRGAHLVLIDDRDLVRERPEFGALIDSPAANPDLILLATAGRPPFRARLYQVRSDSSQSSQ